LKQHQGIWLPDGEAHLTEWMTKSGELIGGVGTYQIKKLRRAISYCEQYRTAVDVGGHCGLWSMQLVKHFQTVHAFEPVGAHRDCFILNVAKRAILHPCALGEKEGFVSIHTAPTSSGDSWVDPAVTDGDIPLKTLDSFELRDVDFIKLDCEGYELFALRGGEETIKQYRPAIIVEQKPGRAKKFGLGERDAVPYLISLGYRLAEEISGDFIMVSK
jgi:FkbM family methyltransferase